MKILLVAPQSEFTRQVATALAQEGHTVATINTREDHLLPARLQSRWVWRLSRRIPLWRRYSNRALQRSVLAQATSCDLLLALKGMVLKSSTLAAVRALSLPTVCWFPDNAANEPYASWVRRAADDWDWFVSFDSKILDQMPTDRRARVRVLPFAVDPEVFVVGEVTPEDRARYAGDVCFVGAPYPDRVALLERIAGKVDLRIWGWEGWRSTSLRTYWRGPLSAQESAKAYHCAKIVVNTNVAPRANGVNVKTFEIAAAGGFQLTDEPADLSESFLPGKEIDTFHNGDEFEQKIQFWMEHAEERKQIAQAGRERVLRDHTMRVRMRQLIGMVTQTP